MLISVSFGSLAFRFLTLSSATRYDLAGALPVHAPLDGSRRDAGQAGAVRITTALRCSKGGVVCFNAEIWCTAHNVPVASVLEAFGDHHDVAPALPMVAKSGPVASNGVVALGVGVALGRGRLRLAGAPPPLAAHSLSERAQHLAAVRLVHALSAVRDRPIAHALARHAPATDA